MIKETKKSKRLQHKPYIHSQFLSQWTEQTPRPFRLLFQSNAIKVGHKTSSYKGIVFSGILVSWLIIVTFVENPATTKTIVLNILVIQSGGRAKGNPPNQRRLMSKEKQVLIGSKWKTVPTIHKLFWKQGESTKEETAHVTNLAGNKKEEGILIKNSIKSNVLFTLN